MNPEGADVHLSPGRPSAEQSQAISGRILDAGERLFVDTGYEAVSMDTVARMAHVSKRTLYERFFGKADLLKAVVGRAFERKVGEIGRINVPSGSLEKSLTCVTDNLVELVTKHDYVALHRILAAEQHRFPGLFEEHFKAGTARLAAVVERVFERHLSAGDIRPEDRRTASEMFVSMVVGPSARRLALDDRRGSAEFSRRAIRLFLNGMLAEPGQSRERPLPPPTEDHRGRQQPLTKSRILGAAIHRFANASYEQVGLRDIANDVGVDVAYVQRSFGSKMGLFTTVLHEVTGQDAASIWASGAGLPDAVVAMMEDDAREHPSRHLALSIALQSLSSPAAGEVVSERLMRILIDPMASSFPAPARTRAKLVAALLIGLGLVERFVQPFRAEEVARAELVHAALSVLVSGQRDGDS